jgi:hypothetical protein
VTALLLLFAGSGCAALIYEVVWFQLLQLVIGSSAISLAVLLSVYMGGLCLGSLALQRMEAARPVRHHPIQVYAFLEFGIGVLGILVLFAIPIVGRMYIAGATQGVIGVFLRGVVSALCLLPPTVLMGATLPALTLARNDEDRHRAHRLTLWREYRRRSWRLFSRGILSSMSRLAYLACAPLGRRSYGHGSYRYCSV